MTENNDTTPFQAYRRNSHFGSLDGLRCVSILSVIWHHTHTDHADSPFGYLGVALFFVVSGFLITTLLLREADRKGQISLSQFYLRRTLRIFPLYYAVIALYTVLVLLVEADSAPGKQFLARLPAFLTYTSNWFVDLSSGNRVIFYFAWSLATEEQFYLFWPAVLRFAPQRWMAATFIGALAVADVAGEQALSMGVAKTAALGVLTSVSMPICVGCLLAFALHSERGYAALFPLLGRRWSAPLFFVALAISGSAQAPFGFTVAAMLGLIGSVCIREDNGLRGPLSVRPIVYVGTISYGVYLLHMLALNASRRVLHVESGGLQFVIVTLLAVVMASVSHRYFEQPFLRLKDRFSPRAPAPPPASA